MDVLQEPWANAGEDLAFASIYMIYRYYSSVNAFDIEKNLCITQILFPLAEKSVYCPTSSLLFSQPVMSVLEACVFATILCGFFGIIFKQTLVMKILAMDVMSTGVIACYVLVASRKGLFTPILSDSPGGAYAGQ